MNLDNNGFTLEFIRWLDDLRENLQDPMLFLVNKGFAVPFSLSCITIFIIWTDKP